MSNNESDDALDQATGDALDGIAIIGMCGRFPGAKNVDEFWRNLREGVESISFFSEEELEAAGVNPQSLRQPNYVRARAVLDDIETFDAAFFGFTPREAEITDPQQRLFLECMWEALEMAGYNSETYKGSIGVYGGVSISNYLLHNLYPNRDVMNSVDSLRVLLGNDKDYLTTWCSYKLNLKGPSVDVQTTCSTSLVAVHMACQSLQGYQCDMALAGGVSLDVPQKAGYFYHEGGINSPDGHCRAFDAKAQGSLNGSGVAVVVLKRLEDAIADGDTIHAVIRGSAVNNDGAQKIGYTAPSVDGQAEVIALAQAVADVAPETINYVETHGTGTALGDPVEVAALAQAFGASVEKKNSVALGSLKTNVGHLGSAAGVAGLIKTALALNHKLIPPTLHYEQPNPQIDFDGSPFYVNAKLAQWPETETPRRAGVSSFGVGGTNAHVVLEEAPALEPSGASRAWQLLLLSAKTASALETASDNLAAHIKNNPAQNLADVAYTLKVSRRAFNYRRMLVCRDAEDAANALQTRAPKRILTGVYEPSNRSVAFMFPGLGDHYVQMGRELYESEPTFRAQIDLCGEILKPEIGLDIRGVLYPAGAEQTTRETTRAGSNASDNALPSQQGFDLRKMLRPQSGKADEAAQLLNQTRLAQPIVFVVEYALARMWMEWGIEPEAMIGYSVGEYVAACLSGVVSLEDALRLVAKRAEMIQTLEAGAMLAVPLAEEEVRPLVGRSLSIAGINGPSLCVVSGATQAVAALEQQLAERAIVCQRLQTTHAFHSGMMEPIAAAFTEFVKGIKLNPPQIPYLSNVTGTWITATEATDPAYWSRHLCGAVRFADGIHELWQERGRVLLEVGAGQMLSSLALQQAAADREQERVALPTLRPYYERQPDLAYLLNTVGQLWLAGVEVDWLKFYQDERRRRVALPTYPFERKRFWIEPQSQSTGDDSSRPQSSSTAKKDDVADWFYLPSWKRTLPLRPSASHAEATEQTTWLVLADEGGLGAKLASRLEQEQQRVVTLVTGAQFARVGEGAYTINPQRLEEYAELVKELDELNLVPTRLLHMWNVTLTDEHAASGIELFTASQDRGFNSLLYLVQAIAEKKPEATVRVGIVSNNMQALTGDERLCPEKATVLVPARVIPQAYPQISCRIIDIVAPAAGTPDEEWLLRQIPAELDAPTTDDVVAYRGRHRWLQDYQAARIERDNGIPSMLRPEGVYLITGGLSGIGTTLAGYLARTLHARLVLIEDEHFPARDDWPEWSATHDEGDAVRTSIETIRALEEAGAEVEVIGANIADEDALRRVVEHADARFGSLHGVLHTAEQGVSEASKATHAPSAHDETHNFQVKVYGAYNLERVLEGREIDFCLLFSSLTAITGGEGRMPHAAANLFLNAFAQARNNDGDSHNWTSVNRDESATDDETAEILPYIFSMADVPQVIVSSVDLLTRLREQRRIDDRSQTDADGATQKSGSATRLHARPQTGTPYVAPTSPTERIITDIWQRLLGIEEVGIHDNFFQLGGNSLVGIQLTSQLREAFQTNIPVHAIFEAATVSDLALVIEDILLTEIEALDEVDAA